MTTVAVAPLSPHRHEHPVPWKAMARVTWLQRRSTLIGLLVVFVACAVAIVVGQAGTHATYASFVANGCVQNRFHVPCGNFENWLSKLCFIVPAATALRAVANILLRWKESKQNGYWTMSDWGDRFGMLWFLHLGFWSDICVPETE